MRTTRSTKSLKNKASSGHGYGIHCSEDVSFSEASRTLVTQNSLWTPEICFVTLQSTFLPQESALLRCKALSCPRNLHCYAAKHFSAPGICFVTPQSTFLPQEAACLHHKALSRLSHRAIQAGVAVFYRRQIRSPAPILEEKD